MLDIGAMELAVVAVVALVVVGPRELPKLVRGASGIYRKYQDIVRQMKGGISDIERELELEEVAKVRAEVMKHRQAFEAKEQPKG